MKIELEVDVNEILTEFDDIMGELDNEKVAEFFLQKTFHQMDFKVQRKFVVDFLNMLIGDDSHCDCFGLMEIIFDSAKNYMDYHNM